MQLKTCMETVITEYMKKQPTEQRNLSKTFHSIINKSPGFPSLKIKHKTNSIVILKS